jgi:hypothetical protein
MSARGTTPGSSGRTGQPIISVAAGALLLFVRRSLIVPA